VKAKVEESKVAAKVVKPVEKPIKKSEETKVISMKHLQSYPGLDGDLGQDPIA
jgi:hypothetical protein